MLKTDKTVNSWSCQWIHLEIFYPTQPIIDMSCIVYNVNPFAGVCILQVMTCQWMIYNKQIVCWTLLILGHVLFNLESCENEVNWITLNILQTESIHRDRTINITHKRFAYVKIKHDLCLFTQNCFNNPPPPHTHSHNLFRMYHMHNLQLSWQQ